MALASQRKMRSKSQTEARINAARDSEQCIMNAAAIETCEGTDTVHVPADECETPLHAVTGVAEAGPARGVNDCDNTQLAGPLGSLRKELLASLEAVHHKLDAVLQREHELEKSIQFNSQRVDEVEKETKENKEEIRSIKKNVSNMQREVASIQEETIAMQRYSRAYNLRFGGVKERKGENCNEVVQNLMKEKLQITKEVKIEIAHRVGKVEERKDRHIIVKFVSRIERDAVFHQGKKNLKGAKEYVVEDLCPSDYKKKSELKPVMKAAYEKGQKVIFHKGKLFINGKIYVT